VFVKSDSCRCQHGSAQHPSIMSIKYFYSELHITLECKDTKLLPIFGCITMSLLMLGDFLKFSYEEPLVLILKIIIFGSNFGKKKMEPWV